MPDDVVYVCFASLLRDGILLVPRTDVMDEEFIAILQRVVNKVLVKMGRSATVTADRLCVVLTVDPLPSE